MVPNTYYGFVYCPCAGNRHLDLPLPFLLCPFCPSSMNPASTSRQVPSPRLALSRAHRQDLAVKAAMRGTRGGAQIFLNNCQPVSELLCELHRNETVCLAKTTCPAVRASVQHALSLAGLVRGNETAVGAKNGEGPVFHRRRINLIILRNYSVRLLRKLAWFIR